MLLRAITHNLVWKVLALMLSLVLWFAFIGEAEVGTSIPAAIQFKNLPGDLEISSEPVDRFFLKVRGPSGKLAMDELARTAVVLDFSAVHRAGEQTFTLDETNINLPPGVTLTRVVPSQLRVRFEKRTAKSIPVEPTFAGPPPKGYRIVSTQVTPPSIGVVGPESRVEQTLSARTDPIDLSATVSNAEFRVSTFLTDSNVRFSTSPLVIVRVILEKIPAKGN